MTRRIANPNYTPGEDVSVTLTSQALSVDVTVKETIPAAFDFVDAGGGTVAGKTVTFTVPGTAGGAPPTLIRADRTGGIVAANEPVIVEGGLVDGALVMVDRTHVFTQVAGTIVEGSTYVRVANDDKTSATYTLTVEADKDTILYLLIDYRIGDDSNTTPPTLTAAMTWVLDMGFEDTGASISVDEANDGDIDSYYAIYGMEIAANEAIELLEQNNTGGRNMYGVAIATGDPPATLRYTIRSATCDLAAASIAGTATPAGGAETAVTGDERLLCLADCGLQVSGGISSMLVLGPIDLGDNTVGNCDDSGRLETIDYLVDSAGENGEKDILVEEGDDVAPDFGGNAGGLGVKIAPNPAINPDALAGQLQVWKAGADRDGRIDFNLGQNIGDPLDSYLVYSLVYLENTSGDCLSAVLEVGSDDAVKVVVNGQMVHVNAVCRGLPAYGAGDMVPVILVPGKNIVLIAVAENGGGTDVRLVVRDTGLAPLVDGSIRPTCEPPGAYPTTSAAEVARSIAPSFFAVPENPSLTVTLSATGVDGPLSIVDTFPVEAEVVSAGGGQVDGNKITFNVSADGDSVYTLQLKGDPESCPFRNAAFSGVAQPQGACAKIIGGASSVGCDLFCPATPESDAAELQAAFAFGAHDAAGLLPDAEGKWCEVPNAPGESYTAVYQGADPLSVAYPNFDIQLAEGSAYPDETRTWGYEILYQGTGGVVVNDPSLPPPVHGARGTGWEIFGPFDDSVNDRDEFADVCVEELYDSFIGGKNWLAGQESCTAATVGNPDDPCTAAGLAPDGIIFRVDVPNGKYRFVLAAGSADNLHAHRILAEDGGAGPPAEIGEHVVLVSNFDQAQYPNGQTGGEPGDGVFAAVGFGDKAPPRGDGTAPDPQFVNMEESGMATLGCPSSPTLEVTEGYIRFHCLQANSNTGPGGARDPNGGNLVLLEIWSVGGHESPQFRRGDANADGGLNITDGIYVLNFLFLGGPVPPCKEAADANDDGPINITDGIYILNFLFLGGPPPPAPGPKDCGPEPNPATSQGCLSYTKC